MKLQISSIFLAFVQFFPSNFPLLDPGGKRNADPCGSGSTALLKTGFFKIVKKMLPEPAACVEAGACQDWTGSTKLRPCSILLWGD